MSLRSWLVAGIVPGVERQPLKKLAVDESALLKLLNRWREEAEKAGRRIERITVAFEAGRDGFWLARWLRARGIERPRYPRIERSRVARAPARQNRPSRH
jgi:transposase